MTDVPFYLTRMGARFYEHTLPELVRQLERLNQNLERLADLHVRAGFQQQPSTEKSDDPQGRDQDLQPPHG
jgi:hypothetical protein